LLPLSTLTIDLTAPKVLLGVAVGYIGFFALSIIQGAAARIGERGIDRFFPVREKAVEPSRATDHGRQQQQPPLQPTQTAARREPSPHRTAPTSKSLASIAATLVRVPLLPVRSAATLTYYLWTIPAPRVRTALIVLAVMSEFVLLHWVVPTILDAVSGQIGIVQDLIRVVLTVGTVPASLWISWGVFYAAAMLSGASGSPLIEGAAEPRAAVTRPAERRDARPVVVVVVLAVAMYALTARAATDFHLERPLAHATSSATVAVDICGPTHAVPGQDAPSWAARDLERLYLGANGVGTAVGGCPSKTVVLGSGAAEQTAFVLGRDVTGAVRSVAVTSSRFGPALFLGGAASYVLKLLHSGSHPVGGTTRLSVATGDLYLVYTPAGTSTLIRPQLVSPSGTAERYTLLPPPVTTAWIAAMKKSHRFLWPSSLPGRRPSVFSLSPSALSPKVVASIVYKSGGSIAVLRTGQAPQVFKAQSRLPLSVIAALAPHQ
jgi:hypothetical protein